eukprot:9476684-Pyramimonas_sp.AAC.2
MHEPNACSFACGHRAVTSARTRCTHCASLCISSAGGTSPPTSSRNFKFSPSTLATIRSSAALPHGVGEQLGEDHRGAARHCRVRRRLGGDYPGTAQWQGPKNKK